MYFYYGYINLTKPWEGNDKDWQRVEILDASIRLLQKLLNEIII